MSKVARSSFTVSNVNRLRFHKVKVFLQHFAGNFHTESDRAITLEDDQNIEYSVYIDGNFSQSGLLALDGSVDVYIPAGKQAILQVLGAQYTLCPVSDLAPFDSLQGVQQRLTLLGYLDATDEANLRTKLEHATVRFQMDYQIAITANPLGEPTCSALDAAYRRQGNGETAEQEQVST